MTAPTRERPDVRAAEAFGAGLCSASLYAAHVLPVPLLPMLALLAPFPVLLVRLRSGLGAGLASIVLAAAVIAALFSGGAGVSYVLVFGIPGVLIADSLSRGRGLSRGCAWAFAVLAAEIGVALLFAYPALRAGILGPLEALRTPAYWQKPGVTPDQVETVVEQVNAFYGVLEVVYPACFFIGAAMVVIANAVALRMFLVRFDPGWLDGGEFENVRWPFALVVAFVASGLLVLLPEVRPVALNVLLVVCFFCALQGLAVVGFYAARLAGPWLLKAALLALVLLNPLSVHILTLLGLFDQWGDFRRFAVVGEGEDSDD